MPIGTGVAVVRSEPSHHLQRRNLDCGWIVGSPCQTTYPWLRARCHTRPRDNLREVLSVFKIKQPGPGPPDGPTSME